jgi:hypothetical protein
MVLRVALQIDGDATGAKEAAREAKIAVEGLAPAAGAAVSRANAEMTRTAAAAAGAVRLTNQQLAQMQFQLQDLAVGLASGQAPFMVIAQQGSQIVQMFAGGTGVLAALKAVGAGVVSFLTNPLNLALLAFAGVSSAASLFFRAVGSGAASTDDLLARHKEVVDEIASAYGGATGAAKRFAHESEGVLQFLRVETAKVLQGQLQADMREAMREIFNVGGALRAAGAQDIFDRLRDDLDQGRASIVAFREQLIRFGQSLPTEGVEAFGQHLPTEELNAIIRDVLEATQGFADLELQLRSGAGAASEFGDALGRLSQIALPKLDERARAAQAFNEAMREAFGIAERRAAEEEYAAALARIAAREKEAADAAAARGAASGGASPAATGALKGELDAMQPLIAAQTAVIAGWDEMRSVASGAFGSIANDIRRGASAGEVLLNVANRIADAFIRLGATGFEALLFGARGAPPGGLFGPLLGAGTARLFAPATLYHQGGTVGVTAAPARPVPVEAFAAAPRLHDGLGLRPREFPAILEEGETVIPRGQRASGGNTYVFNVQTPSPQAFAQSRSVVTRAAARLAGRFGRFT